MQWNNAYGLGEGGKVGDSVGSLVGLFDGLLVGANVGMIDNVGSEVGELIGLIEIEGFGLGDWEWAFDGVNEGGWDRAIDGVNEGGKVGAWLEGGSVSCCITVAWGEEQEIVSGDKRSINSKVQK